MRKTPEQLVAFVDEHGRNGVLTRGTLRGADLGGEPFEGVRYADLLILNESGQIASRTSGTTWRLSLDPPKM